ncbi:MULTISPECIES: ead/Ea22-like family protein [Citrobacter]|uniref:ead/Ea22-like family protein n=1 Tax=Citrobacter TaxID=544 RepID=UPI001CB81499|nr:MULTISPECIES: ead/Ea22-like family protein [Citrobacter]
MTALNKQSLREAAQEEIMLRSVSDTSDAWQDEASPEAVLALLDELEAAEKRIAELEARTVKLPTGTEVNGFHMLIEEEVIARLRESGVNPIVVRAAGIGVKGE